MSAVTAFGVCLLLYPVLMAWLKRLEVRQQIRPEKEVQDLHGLHKHKDETPTMGGILILVGLSVAALLWADLKEPLVWGCLAVTLGMGAIGFVDDWLKWKHQHTKGLRALIKLALQAAVALFFGWWLFQKPEFSTVLHVPFLKEAVVNLGWCFVPFVGLVLIGTSNAVNLTDGLDGLAIGCTIMIAIAYAGMSYVTGHMEFAEYLLIPFIPGSSELVVICAALVGVGMGFLWYNAHPATLFMGDTGSLALGGALGAVAVLTKKELWLVIVGGIFVVEALSVILQILSYRLTGKRVFLMAPLHHHFQLKGWPENKVTVRFWIVGAVLVFVALSTLKLR